MTTKEAIDTIELAIAEVEWEYSMSYAVAFEKAIDALKKLEQIKKIAKAPKHSLEVAFRYAKICEILWRGDKK